MEEIYQKVYEIVSQIPAGKVATYGQIAEFCNIKSPRFVGKILHENTDPKTIPCHRVVNWRGKVAENYAFGGADSQKKKLEKEGIVFKNGKMNLNIYQWKNKED